MQARAARRFAVALVLLLCSTWCIPRVARPQGTPAGTTARTAASPADTTVRAATPPDSTVRAAAVPQDTTRAAAARAAATGHVPVARAIDVVAERKVGGGSLEDILPLRRPVFLSPLPLFGPIQGVLALPDGGGPIRLEGVSNAAERATDEPLLGSVELGWGAPWLAFALNDPRTDATETLDLDSLRVIPEPETFLAPGEAVARPEPVGPAFPRAEADTARGGTARTTLVYRRGSGDAQLTGIRFLTSMFRHTIYASYTRNQANGWAPLDRALAGRYALRAELGRAASHRLELEGLIYERSIRDSVGGASEWDRRHLALRAARYGARSSDRWQIRIGSGKETWIISPDAFAPEAGSRERWEFPTIAANALFSWSPTRALTWIGSVEGASRKVVYRADSLPAFEPRRGEARGHVGSRLALGASAGAGIDAAYDVRETQSGFLDARASLWGSAEGARGRIDVESVHDRPSWVDLLTPATLHTFFSPSTFLQTDLSRAGDPSIRPRRLTGALASAGMTPIRGFDVEVSGSYRRVTHDFGWNVSADTVGGVYQVSSLAGERGSGWLSHAALGWEFRRGPIRARGVGWIRGGPDSLSPQSGSPPRRALDAALELRAILFKGDLPLRFGVESHARGPRRGLIREPGRVTWDGTLSADFGAAGVYLRVRDVFDQRPGSAIWDPAAPSGAPLPGRTFQAGVAWSLWD